MREALRGSHQDYTTGNLNRAILLLAIPMVLEMVLESLFAVVDVFWVGRLGANAVATVGITESMLALVFAIGLGVSMSTGAMVARRIGEKDPEDAAIAGVQAIVLGLLISLAIGIPAGIFAPQLLGLMGASPAIVASGSGYARIALGGCGAIVMLFLNNAIFRGAGDAAIAMRLLWVSNIINLILDPCLIFGLGPFPHMGVTGAALATFTGRSIGVLYQFYRLLKGTERIHVLARHLRLNLRSHGPPAARLPYRHSPVRHRQRKLDRPGAHHLPLRLGGGCGLHRRHPHRGLLHSPRLGAQQCRRHPRRPESGRQTSRSRRAGGMAHRPLQHALSGNHRHLLHRLRHARRPPLCGRPGRGSIAAMALRTLSCGNVGYAYGMVMLQAFNGAGDTLTPTIVNFFGFWVLELPLAWVLARPLAMHAEGAFLSVVIAECSMAIAGVVLFRRGRWKRKKI